MNILVLHKICIKDERKYKKYEMLIGGLITAVVTVGEDVGGARLLKKITGRLLFTDLRLAGEFASGTLFMFRKKVEMEGVCGRKWIF